jgi:hypothetical protein
VCVGRGGIGWDPPICPCLSLCVMGRLVHTGFTVSRHSWPDRDKFRRPVTFCPTSTSGNETDSVCQMDFTESIFPRIETVSVRPQIDFRKQFRHETSSVSPRKRDQSLCLSFLLSTNKPELSLSSTRSHPSWPPPCSTT